MSDPRQQVKKIRQQEILEAFQNSDELVLTTGEVSETIDSVEQETLLEDLKTMRGDRLRGRKSSAEGPNSESSRGFSGE